MNRLARRLHILKHCGAPTSFNPEQRVLEAALRGRMARKVRACLRRMEPVVLLTPRWSRSQRFLEELALDLAVGEPGVSCRTVSFRPLKGRSAPEAWRFVLNTLAQLSSDDWSNLRIPSPASDEGFQNAMETLLYRAQQVEGAPVALLAHGAEHLPLEVSQAISMVWNRFLRENVRTRRISLLLAGTVDAPTVQLSDAPRLVLEDYGEAEATAALVGRVGPSSRQLLEAAARFTGGVPALVEALGTGARAIGGMPRSRSGLIRCLGGVGDEVRGAVDIVNADPALANRLDELLAGHALEEDPVRDQRLLMAGLIRKIRDSSGNRVMLRAPAIGMLVG